MFGKKNDGEKQSLATKVKAKIDRAERAFLISSVLMTLIFAANSVYDMMSGWKGMAVQYVTVALLAAYVIAFVVLIVLFKKNKGELKENMQNYKFAIKVMKKVVNIINLALALSVMAETITVNTGAKQIFSFIVALMGIGMAVFKFVLFVFKFSRKKKKAKMKALKKAQRQEEQRAMTNKIKSMLVGERIEEEIAVTNAEETDNTNSKNK